MSVTQKKCERCDGCGKIANDDEGEFTEKIRVRFLAYEKERPTIRQCGNEWLDRVLDHALCAILELCRRLDALAAENASQAIDTRVEEIERLKESFRQIQSWAMAYPPDIFPKPDLKKAREVLEAAGLTLDAVNANAMRHVLDGIKDIVEQALKDE